VGSSPLPRQDRRAIGRIDLGEVLSVLPAFSIIATSAVFQAVGK
jgi:hypothetical protein